MVHVSIIVASYGPFSLSNDLRNLLSLFNRVYYQKEQEKNGYQRQRIDNHQ